MSSSRKPNVIRRSGLEPSKMEVAEKPAVSDDDIAKVIGYCKYYFRAAAAAEATGNIEKFEAKLDKRNGDISSRLNSVAESMEMDRGHLDLTCQAVADMLKTKSVEEILEVFAIKDGEFTPEEEEEMRKEIQRALE